MVTTEAEQPEMDPVLARKISEFVAKSFVRSGVVDPRGKTEEQLRIELLDCIREYCREGLIGLVVDHTGSLLKQARTFRQSGKPYFACLMYATWAEHWLNGLISTAGQRRDLPAEEVTQIIRDTPLRGKLTWLVGLLSLPRIAERHRNAVVRLMDLRNGFVHYKWQGKDDDTMDKEDADFERSVASFEATVKYLRAYQARNIYAGSQLRVRRAISAPKQAEPAAAPDQRGT